MDVLATPDTRELGILLQILPHESLLQTLLEVSVAFVGFSMLASVFRSRTDEELVRFAAFRDVAEVGLLAALGSLAPLLLNMLGLPEVTLWRCASGAFAALFVVGSAAAIRRQTRTPGFRDRAKARPIRLACVYLNFFAVVAPAWANCVWPSYGSGTLHVWVVALTLVQAAQLFLYAAFEDTGV